MTKVWEESWKLDTWNDEPIAVVRTPGALLALWPVPGQFGPTRDPEEVARARLAACAPAMARLLLKLESTSCRSDMVECPMCSASAYSHEAGVPVDHKPDCEWVAVLRRAGVR